MDLIELKKMKKSLPLDVHSVVDEVIDEYNQDLQSLRDNIDELKKELVDTRAVKKSASGNAKLLKLVQNEEKNISDRIKSLNLSLKRSEKQGVDGELIRLALNKKNSATMEKLIVKISKLTDGPLRKEVGDMLLGVEKIMNDHEKKTRKSSLKDNIVWFLSEQTKMMQKLVDYVDLMEVKIKKAKPVPVNPVWDEAPRRAKLAPQCVNSAKDLIKESRKWFDEHDGVDDDMVSMSLGDAADHYQLGLAILDGSKSKIDQKSSMDTASREEISDAVWRFVSSDIYEGYGKVKPTGLSKSKK